MRALDQLPDSLTQRESDILFLLGQNLTDREIAERLILSTNSVKWYVRQIYEKLSVANRREAVKKAVELGIFASKTPASRPAHNLPRQLNSFVGREKEIDQVTRLVREHPLVTVTGAGGVGKSRLALQAAGNLLPSFSAGVWWVELAPVIDPVYVPIAVASVFQIQSAPGQRLVQTLCQFVGEKRILLILDNCEHVIDAARQLSIGLLQACPHLKILATSREILDVNGEFFFRCPALSLPVVSPGDPPAPDLQRVEASEAVRLFVERAAACAPGFSLGEQNAPVLSEICWRVDGIPLAIELAAARTRAMTVEDISSRLGHAFNILTSNNRPVLPHHQTLGALIDWSYQLLSAGEKVLLQRLSVFSGGWTIEAAEEICPDDGFSQESGPSVKSEVVKLRKPHILDLLCSLVDKSLVHFEPDAKQGQRYHLLEMVRQFAGERLAECGDELQVCNRHLAYFEQLALQAEPHLRARQAKYWLERLDRDLGNVRKSLQWSITYGQIEKGLQLAAALTRFWIIRNHSSDGARWIWQLLLEQKKRNDLQTLGLDSKVARGRALNMLCSIIERTVNQGVPVGMDVTIEELNRESLAIFHELRKEFPRDYALALFTRAETLSELVECREWFFTANERFWTAECDLGLDIFSRPDYERSRMYLEESLAIRREIGDIDGEGGTLWQLAYITLAQGDPQGFVKLVNGAIDCLEIAEDRNYAAIFRGELAKFYIDQGDYQEAERLLEMEHAAALELDLENLEYNYLKFQAYFAWVKKEYGLAVKYAEKALGYGKNIPLIRKFLPVFILARLALLQGQMLQASLYLKDLFGMGIFSVTYDRETLANIPAAIHLLGIFNGLQGQFQRCTILLGMRDAICERFGWPLFAILLLDRSQSLEILASARTALGEEAFATAWETGRTMASEQRKQLLQQFVAELPA